MSTDIVVPALGESVTEAIIAQWRKQPGDPVGKDEIVVELETDKVTLEVTSPTAGVMEEQAAAAGDTVAVGALLGRVGDGAGAVAAAPAAPAGGTALPAAAKMAADHQVDLGAVTGSGKGGRILKEDVQAALKTPQVSPPAVAAPQPTAAAAASAATGIPIPTFERPASAERPTRDREERVRMTKLRQTIARRLKEAQNTAAMLSTFNEVDMTELMAMRARYKDRFQKKHGGTRLGFMSFFVKAAVAALRDVPAVNAAIEGDELVYRNYYDVGVAVSTPQGLVVPVVRDCDRLSFAEVEARISDLGLRGRDGKLTLPEMTGGTFTITNGGVFGSLLSTPILNPPQSGILGMHKIQDRPVAMNGKVEVRPMMYLALSYDHRVIDGREAVTFLVRIKEGIENPDRLLLDV